MRTREEIEKEIKVCEQAIENHKRVLKDSLNKPTAYALDIRTLETVVDILKWVLGDFNE